MFLSLMLLWQLETFKRTLMQSLQEDDENPTVSYPSFSAPEHTVLICVLILEVKYYICGSRVKVVTSEELQIQIWQSEEHHVSCSFTNPSSGKSCTVCIPSTT